MIQMRGAGRVSVETYRAYDEADTGVLQRCRWIIFSSFYKKYDRNLKYTNPRFRRDARVCGRSGRIIDRRILL